ncbi:MAG TPA: YoaK family protein [Candidatus Binatia bacterium]|nr:YoaK family protein [Candidatus Binatia bacterium]
MAKAIRPRHTLLGRESMLLLLTLAAASVDAISYLGLGQVFTAMMTGNTVLLGLALAQGEVLAALRSILALIGFTIGVFAGAIIVERESEPAEWPAAVTAALAFEALVLAIFAAASTLFDSTRGVIIYLLIILSAFAMGIQSAAVRRLGVPGIATTYITGTLTSLMVDLLGWLRSLSARLPVSKTVKRDDLARLPWDQRVGLLAGVVTLYCVGALIGGVLQVHSPTLAPLFPLGAVILVVVNAGIRQRRRQRPLSDF